MSGSHQQSSFVQSASRGIFWSMFGNVGVSAIRFVGTMILARMIAPEEFGILGMATLFTGLIGIFGNLGLSAALVQLKQIDEEYLSTAFWTNMICGTLLFAFTALISPLAAMFFNEPKVQPALVVVATTFVFSSISLTHAAVLYRELKFKEMAAVEIAATVLRVIFIIVFAIAGFGFWSLIWGMVLERIIKTLFIWRLYAWWPKIIFIRSKFDQLFHFGRNIYGQSFVNYFSENVDFIVVGRVLGAQSLAFYQFAYNIPHLVLSHISYSVENVAFPLYSKIQDEKERLALGFLKSVRFISMITFPLMAGLAFVAGDFMTSVYGPRWGAAVVPLQILCCSGALRSVSVPIHPVLQAIGRPDITLKASISFLPVTVVMVIFLSRWGTVGVASGMTLGAVIYLILVRKGAHMVGTSLREFFRNLIPAIVCSVLMLCALWGFTKILPLDPWAAVYRLAVRVVAGGCVYAGFMYLFFRQDFLELFGFIKKIVFRKG